MPDLLLAACHVTATRTVALQNLTKYRRDKCGNAWAEVDCGNPVAPLVGMLNRSHYGVIAGLVGAFLFWKWRERSASTGGDQIDRGEVIFRNTPQPSEP